MNLLSLEHERLGYAADFALYGLAIGLLALDLLAEGPHAHWMALSGYTLAGLLLWSPIEYLLHRFVLHGLAPFKHWHARHHERPTALISSPTVFSASLIVLLVFLPALLVSDRWRASAFTLGILIGYTSYGLTHHAMHHWHGGRWLRGRKRWHALHHHDGARGECFGVTSALWDYLLGSAHR